MRSKDQILLEDLYTREILNEKRKERLFPMFQKLVRNFADLEDGFPFQYNDSSVKMEFSAKDKSPEEYRSELKQYNLEELEGDFRNLIKTVSVTAKKENLVMIILKKVVKDMERKLEDMKDYGVIPSGEWDDEGDEMTTSREDFDDYLKQIPKSLSASIEHWDSLPIPKLHQYLRTVSPNEEWYIVARTAQQFEEEWKAKNGTWINISDELRDKSIEEIIKLDKKMSWFDLKKPYCQKEGEAMGHCGNKGGFAMTDTVLSLRETKKGKDGILISKPHLTFILKSGEYLGEMKGRGNSKPKSEYHPYIVQLLLHKKPNSDFLIKRIEGGGYKPMNNFSLEDLEPKLLQTIIKARPEMIIDQIKPHLMQGEQIPSQLKAAINSSPNKKKIQLYLNPHYIHLVNTFNPVKKIKKINDDLTIEYGSKTQPFNPNYPLEA